MFQCPVNNFYGMYYIVDGGWGGRFGREVSSYNLASACAISSELKSSEHSELVIRQLGKLITQ